MAPLLVNYQPSDIGGLNLSNYISSTLLPGETKQDVEPAVFLDLLNAAKYAGFKAIVVDIWWGLVQTDINGGYDWRYYDKLFNDIQSVNDATQSLRIVPGLAFHQCGGNVGDGNVSILLPTGALSCQDDNGVTQDLRCKSEYSDGTGNYGVDTAYSGAPVAMRPQGCEEALSPWATNISRVQQRYYNFILAFMQKYANLTIGANPVIKDMYIGLGPCGELRYPSYNAHDKSLSSPKRIDFPTRGAFQGYSILAINSLRDYLRRKYNSDAVLQAAWGVSSITIDNVWSPNNTPHFFDSGCYKNSEYGKDIFDWYSKSLLNHAEVMFRLAGNARTDAGLDCLLDLHMKVPGIHWTQNGERIAEMNAGIVPSRSTFDNFDDYGYKQILTAIKNIIKPDGLSFTCLEMDDNHQSLAKSFVYWFVQGCEKYGIKVDGENALGEELMNPRGWQNMEEVMRYSAVRVITLLRANELRKNLHGSGEKIYEKAKAVEDYLRSLHANFNNGRDIKGVAEPIYFKNGATPSHILTAHSLSAKPVRISRSGITPTFAGITRVFNAGNKIVPTYF
jgi:beta-amylase